MRKRKTMALSTKYKPNQAGLVNTMGLKKIHQNKINSKTNFMFNYNYLKQRETTNKKEKINRKSLEREIHLKHELNMHLIKYFENYPDTHVKQNYMFNANSKYATIYLKNDSFKEGTVRITVPGRYILKEDIIFNPNEENDFQPKHLQMISGKYPMENGSGFHLGFFAAITVETDNVIIDLNGHTIKQSKLHNLQQRFFSHIELANSPFIPKQGPAKFSTQDNFKPSNYVQIKNGSFGLSSHHSIHGNGMRNILINDCEFNDFEVAAIALNGATKSTLKNLKINGTSQNIPVVSTYSQSRFIRTFLKKLKTSNPSATLNIHTGEKNIDTIIEELNNSLNLTKELIINDLHIDNNLFKNETGLYDGNAYGIVLNTRGIVVNDFIRERTEKSIGNENIYLENISIQNIITEPKEHIGIKPQKEKDPVEEQKRLHRAMLQPAFGGKAQVGPIGDIFRINDVINNGKYKEDVLSNAQLIISKYSNSKNKKGTSNISPEIIEWVETGSDIMDVLSKSKLGFVHGVDSMVHHMKGNIGLFISAGKNIVVDGLTIDNIISKGTRVGDSFLIDKKNFKEKIGDSSCGCCVTGSINIKFRNEKINDIISDNGNSYPTNEINSTIIHF